MENDLIDAIRDRLATLASRVYAPPARSDFDPETTATVRAVREFTATSPERIYAACEAIRYVSRCDVPGDIVECGVWRGGMVMAMLRTLLEQNDTARDVYLYDTFAGMSPPTERDETFKGASAASLMSRSDPKDPNSVWCTASLQDVRQNVASVGYDPARIHFVEGKIEETLPGTIPERIAVLRLDTDWYASTKHELNHLYPRLTSGGVLIIDDYGHWKGAREAVDEYVTEHALKIMLGRTDYTGRIAVKP
jgi:O-methyltransferase